MKPAQAHTVPTLKRLLPVLGWLPSYQRDWLVPDILAGLAVWAVMVPESMAYAGMSACRPSWGSIPSSPR